MTVADLIWKLLYYPYDMEVKVCIRPRVEPATSVDASVDSVDTSIDIDANKVSVVIYGDKPYNFIEEVAAVENYKA